MLSFIQGCFLVEDLFWALRGETLFTEDRHKQLNHFMSLVLKDLDSWSHCTQHIKNASERKMGYNFVSTRWFPKNVKTLYLWSDTVTSSNSTEVVCLPPDKSRREIARWFWFWATTNEYPTAQPRDVSHNFIHYPLSSLCIVSFFLHCERFLLLLLLKPFAIPSIGLPACPCQSQFKNQNKTVLDQNNNKVFRFVVDSGAFRL